MLRSLAVSISLCFDAHPLVLLFGGAATAGSGCAWWRSAHDVGLSVLGG